MTGHDTVRVAVPPPVARRVSRLARRRTWVSIVVIATVAVSAASMLILGLWAYGWPRSFADFIDYAPYNRHLIHDAGAFQIGIGVSLAAALTRLDGVLVALSGFIVASGLHTISHQVDRHIGGHGSDVPTLATLSLIAVIGFTVHIIDRRSQP